MKRMRFAVLLFLLSIIFTLNPIKTNAAEKFLTVNQKNVTLMPGKSVKIKVKVKFRLEGYTVTWKSSKPSVADVSQTGNWKGNTITFRVKAYKPGTAKIVIRNYYNDQKVTIKVKVKKPWDGVKVSIPDTIGDSDHPETRMKITKYNFYSSFVGSDYYDMYVQYRCVKTGGYESFGEYFYCYDKYNHVIYDNFICAFSLYPGNSYSDTFMIPKNTKYIRFHEYPEPPTYIDDYYY